MKHRLLALLLAACTLLCLVLTSCSKSTDSNQNDSADAATQDTQQAESSGNYKDTVVWAQAADVTSMDPHIGKETAAVTVTCNIFSTLMQVIGDGDPRCLLRAISSSTTKIGSLPSARASSSTMEAT